MSKRNTGKKARRRRRIARRESGAELTDDLDAELPEPLAPPSTVSEAILGPGRTLGDQSEGVVDLVAQAEHFGRRLTHSTFAV